MKKEIIDFYKKTSAYTELGLYKEIVKTFPNDIMDLCLLQRQQTIHPFDLTNSEMIDNKESIYGDMTKIDKTRLIYENDIFPTAQSILAELLRRNADYSIKRDINDKIHICCREQSILLASILKAKNIAARARSGFAKYSNDNDFQAGDHWITEYYNENLKRWVLVDADMYFWQDEMDFDLLDIPNDRFIFGAEAYLGLRNGKYKIEEIFYSSDPLTFGLKAAIRGLFYDFHSLMNDEIIFLHVPKYIVYKNFELTEEEYTELDDLAKLMLDPDTNFEKIKFIWDTVDKFKVMSGGLNS